VDSRAAFALGSLAVSAALTALGTYSGRGSDENRTYLVVLGVAIATVVILFWVVVPRARGGKAALTLSLLAVLSLALFWLGLPVPFAAAATLLALDARGQRGSAAAIVVSALVVVAAAVAAVAG
jgi:hypothetical protein